MLKKNKSIDKINITFDKSLFSELIPKIFEEYQICNECLGRQFAILGYGMTNAERGKSILNVYLMELHYDILGLEADKKEEFQQKIGILKSLYYNANYKEIKFILDKLIGENQTELSLNHEFMNKTKGQFDNIDKNQIEEEITFLCYLCDNLFSKINIICNKIIDELKEYEFNNFLLGTVLQPSMQEKEDEFRVRFGITTGESFKRNLNRVVGIILSKTLNKPAEFDCPELNIILDVKKSEINYRIHSNPIFIYGRYRKYIRGIPQTHWPHKPCKGEGCQKCNFTGKQYETSVEELISPFILDFAQGTSSVFHGAGREDIDARCLGTGRPFIIEVKQPKKRFFNLKQLENTINSTVGDKVDVLDLKFVDKHAVKDLKSKGERTRKTYSLIVEAEDKISSTEFANLMKKAEDILLNSVIYQRTPTRVAHRRADKTREKRIYAISGSWVDENHFKLEITAMGGTYIKELVSSDDGRTSPSLTEIFQNNLKCIELDVIDVKEI
ncbi:MAG: tRNA pseudouridine(54/55) synthase Pus10 [Promethearchaeota archaeon]